MNAKQTGMIFTLLWLTGCAAVGPLGETDSAAATDTSVQKAKTGPADGSAARQASASVDTRHEAMSSHSVETEILTLARLLERLDLVTTVKSNSPKQRIKQMDARFKELDPADKYEFALLLSRKGASARSVNRAISILDDLQAHVKDRIVEAILLLHRRNLVLQKQYRSERNKTIELEKKIEHLKGLEQDLDKSNTRMQESLNPMPGDAPQP